MPLPMEENPRAAFELLFGDTGTTDSAARARRLREKRSILDSVLGKAHVLSNSVGAADRVRFDGYLESIEDVERRLETAEAQSARELPVVQQPASVPATFVECAKLMMDLQVLAYQAGSDARQHVHAGQGAERPRVSGNRRLRRPPRVVASWRRAREDRVAGQGQRASHVDAGVASWRSWKRHPTATDRCSTTRCSSTAAATAIRTSTIRRTPIVVVGRIS